MFAASDLQQPEALRASRVADPSVPTTRTLDSATRSTSPEAVGLDEPLARFAQGDEPRMIKHLHDPGRNFTLFTGSPDEQVSEVPE